MDNDAPATKQDIEQLREQLRGEMAEIRTHITETLTEFTRDIETKLLSAFHAYGRGTK